jgi:hypothetical protein
MLALETARRDAVRGAAEAIEDVDRHGPKSMVVLAVVWRLAEQLVEIMRLRAAQRLDPLIAD